MAGILADRGQLKVDALVTDYLPELSELLQNEIWAKLGAEHDGYILLDAHQEGFAPAGVNVTLRDLARFGQMMMQHGRYNGQQIVPRKWVDDIRTGGDLDAWRAADANSGDDMLPSYDNGSYRSYWWVADRSCRRFAAIGLGGQTVIVDPVAKMVVVKFSSSPDAPAGAKITRTAFQAADAIFRILSGHGCRDEE